MVDKALTSTLGWLACAIIIVAFIYIYNATNENKAQLAENNLLWVKTEGIIKSINDETDSKKNTLQYWIVEFVDKDSIKHEAKVYFQSPTQKNINDKVMLFYNPLKPDTAEYEEQ